MNHSGSRAGEARTRRPSHAPGAALLLQVLLLGLFACGPDPRPSIVLVTLDTLRVDHVGAYGDTRGLTPNLDALAASGLVHEAAYTTMPTTGPAHVSLFTGALPSEHGVLRNGNRLDPAYAKRTAIVRLRDAGYATAAFVTSQLMGPAATGLSGFEIYDVPRGVLRHGTKAVELALAWLDQERRRPIFLFVHLYDAHAPYGTADDKRLSVPLPRKRYGWVDPALYEDEAERAAMADRYADGVRSADAALGTLLDGVRARLETPVLILVASDHGETLDEQLTLRGFAYDHGEFLDAETVEILLVASGPGVEVGRSTGAASIRDLHDTLLGAAGLLPADTIARDLRRPSDARRIVSLQRRQVGLAPRDAVRRHAAAASDGRHLVIVGDDGAPTQVAPESPRDLVATAQRGIPEPAQRATQPVDEATRRALESLGYAE